jgi:uncharacterized protein
MDQIYFFDTYALFEISNGNENYRKYTNCRMFTLKINLFELFYNYLKIENEKKSKIILTKYYPFTIVFDIEILSEAALFRWRHKKRKMSMVDCISYITAKKFGIKFLTGDKEFVDLENVEFVK